MLEFYAHPRLDLNGTWDTEEEQIALWFPMAQLTPEERKSINRFQQASEFKRRTGEIAMRVKFGLVTLFEHPVTKEDHCPLIKPSELYLEEPTEGLMLIEVGQPKEEYAEDALEHCAFITAELYADQMYERVEQ